jgi:tRNA A58 N-methylase Trm61
MLREPQTVKHGAFDCVVLDVKDPREFVSSVKERRKGEALMRSLEEEPLRKTTAAVPRREPKTPAVEVVEEEPVEKPPIKRRLAPQEDAPRAEQRPVGRMVRVPKSRDD